MSSCTITVICWGDLRQGPKIGRRLSQFCRSPVEYNHPSLFAGSQIRGVALGIKIHRWDRSLDRSIRTVRQIEQVFGPYRVMFEELNENNQLPLQCFCRGKKSAKNTRGTTTLIEGRNGLPLVIQNTWKQTSQNTQAAAMGGATRSERSGKAGNKLVCIQKRLRASDCIRLLFFTMDVVFQDYHEPYSECNQKYQLTVSSIQTISLDASSVHETSGGALQTHSFLWNLNEHTHDFY